MSRPARSTGISRSTRKMRSRSHRPWCRRHRTTPSKAGADLAVNAFSETYGLPVTISNCANNYGPYQFPEKVIPHFVVSVLNGKPMTLYRSSRNRREWLHVDDHCRGHRDHHRAGPDRGDIQRRQRSRGRHRGYRRPDPRDPRCRPRVENLRSGPARPRPTLPARLVEDPHRGGVAASHRLRGGLQGNRPLVPRQRRLVAGAPRPLGCRRGRVAGSWRHRVPVRVFARASPGHRLARVDTERNHHARPVNGRVGRALQAPRIRLPSQRNLRWSAGCLRLRAARRRAQEQPQGRPGGGRWCTNETTWRGSIRRS